MPEAMADSFEGAWFVLPARGGSKGVPRKVLRHLGGKSLILHSLHRLSQRLPRERLVVSTDSAEIASVCEPYASIHPRSAELAGDAVTLDDVAVAVAAWLKERGASDQDLFVTLQPTSPFLSLATLERGLALLRGGASSLLTVQRDGHLRWTRDDQGKPAPLYKARVNRQWAAPCFVETGGIIAARIGDVLAHNTRIVQPVELLELSEMEGLDIDTHADWAMAEYFAQRKRILIRGDASPKHGMGHVHRMLALAYELASHRVTLVTRRDGGNELGAKFLGDAPFELAAIDDEAGFLALLEQEQPDIAILDVLNTEPEYVQAVHEHARVVVNFEDLGPGARHADIVINDLYTDLSPQENHWYSVQYSIVGPTFENTQPRADISERVEKVLISFGGTDPNNLTIKALSALEQVGFVGEVIVVLGPGYAHPAFELETFGLNGDVHRSVQNMALLTRDADVAITAAGRTVTELMTMGVPMITMCQNMNELRHTHASSPYGVINLGLGQHVDASTLAEHLRLLIEDKRLRADMRARGFQAVRDRSNKRVAESILKAAQAIVSRKSEQAS
jgi:spore coat polysaccharide biosynthesis predicted glycosyltransferase SpsG/CMP-N-acetylneuraminic acid synthetase